MPSVAERFWAKVDQQAGKCWTWTAAVDGKGYGKLTVDKRTVAAHRLAYALANGPIPPGLVVRHSCDNPPCVNPAHLSLGSMSDNTRDMVERGRHPRIAQDVCDRGHALTEANTYKRPDRPGSRECRLCKGATNRRSYRKLRTADAS